FAAFETRALGALQVTALPLTHSKPTFGYMFEGDGQRFAYLTDTVGLPDATCEFLQRQPLDVLILDCSMPPQPQPPRNHNDLTLALQTIDQLRPGKAVLTHIGHTLDAWLMGAAARTAGPCIDRSGRHGATGVRINAKTVR
ncbi:carbon-phosphorus lyase complex accessory protein, partial [Pseudomonas savastanoi pv. glycinea str. race 4]